MMCHSGVVINLLTRPMALQPALNTGVLTSCKTHTCSMLEALPDRHSMIWLQMKKILLALAKMMLNQLPLNRVR